MFPSFELFGRTVGMYSVCAVVGLLVCGFVGRWLGRKRGIEFEDILMIMLAIVAGLMAGGHIMYGITHTSSIIDTLSNAGELGFIGTLRQLGVSFGGSVFYGGFIGGSLAILIYTRFSKSVGRVDMLDIWAVCVPLFHAFGRVGCFLGGCCYGIESEFGFTVHGNTFVPEVNGVSRFPVALAEAVCNLIIFAVLLYITRKGKCVGKRIYVYMLIYPPIRFITEFFRGDEIRGFLFGLSTSQWISLILIVFAAVMLAVNRYGKPKSTAQE